MGETGFKAAVPSVFVTDFPSALAYYTGPLGFHALFTFGDPPFYAHVARGEAVLALRHVDRPVLDHTADEALLSAFIEVDDVDGLFAPMQSVGALIAQAPRDEAWAMRSFVVRDTDSNLVCFAVPLPRND